MFVVILYAYYRPVKKQTKKFKSNIIQVVIVALKVTATVNRLPLPKTKQKHQRGAIITCYVIVWINK